MRLTDIEKKARNLGIKDTWRFSKGELIKLIQRTEGNAECFTANGQDCLQTTCCFREDCLK